MILVTTAGKVGTAAALSLARRDVPVRVLVRSRAKTEPLRQAGVDVLNGDLDDDTSVARAVQGAETMILVSPAVPAQEMRLITAARDAGTGHVVKITGPASLTSANPRQRAQAEIEALLQHSGLEHTLLRNNFYMQNFLMLAPGISARSSFGSSSGTGTVGFIDTRDVAAVAAEIATTPAAHRGHTYSLTGPELLSYPDVAAILSRVLGRPIVFHDLTFTEEVATMTQVGVPEPIATLNALAVHAIAEGTAAWLSDDVRKVLGRPAASFERFAIDHAAQFG